jgi:hypothetical protein
MLIKMANPAIAPPQARSTEVGQGCGNIPCPNLMTVKVSTKAIAMPNHANVPSLKKMSLSPFSINS